MNITSFYPDGYIGVSNGTDIIVGTSYNMITRNQYVQYTTVLPGQDNDGLFIETCEKVTYEHRIDLGLFAILVSVIYVLVLVLYYVLIIKCCAHNDYEGIN